MATPAERALWAGGFIKTSSWFEKVSENAVMHARSFTRPGEESISVFAHNTGLEKDVWKDNKYFSLKPVTTSKLHGKLLIDPDASAALTVFSSISVRTHSGSKATGIAINAALTLLLMITPALLKASSLIHTTNTGRLWRHSAPLGTDNGTPCLREFVTIWWYACTKWKHATSA